MDAWTGLQDVSVVRNSIGIGQEVPLRVVQFGFESSAFLKPALYLHEGEGFLRKRRADKCPGCGNHEAVGIRNGCSSQGEVFR